MGYVWKISGVALFVVASTPCWAAPLVNFEASLPLFLILHAIGLGLFVLVGREKGAFAYIVLISGLFIWDGIERYLSKQAAQNARKATSDTCLQKAGSVGKPIQYIPDQIIVRIDKRLKPGTENGIRTSISTSEPSASVRFVNELPSGRDKNFVYVDISVTQAAIDGAKGL